MRQSAVILVVLAALLGSGAAIAARKTLRIRILCDAQGELRGIVMPDGRSELRGSEPFQAFVGRVLPNRSARIVITADVDTPYRCIGGFIFYSQRLGYKRIGFVAEPSELVRGE